METIVKPYTGADSTYHYAVLPVTLDSTQAQPYVQYALMKEGDKIMQPGADGAEFPPDFTNPSTGPAFVVSFIPQTTMTGVTPDIFAEIWKPTLTAAPQPTGDGVEHTLVWDSNDPEVSMWPATDGLGNLLDDEDKTIDLLAGRQYMVVTEPLSAVSFNDIPAGIMHFSLEPSGGVFDKAEIGILAVHYTLKLNKTAT